MSYVVDNFDVGKNNIIQMGGIDKENVRLGLGSLVLDLGNGDAFRCEI